MIKIEFYCKSIQNVSPTIQGLFLVPDLFLCAEGDFGHHDAHFHAASDAGGVWAVQRVHFVAQHRDGHCYAESVLRGVYSGACEVRGQTAAVFFRDAGALPYAGLRLDRRVFPVSGFLERAVLADDRADDGDACHGLDFVGFQLLGYRTESGLQVYKARCDHFAGRSRETGTRRFSRHSC